MKVAPIALFVYARPWHTKETVEAMQKNDLAEDSDLVIFCDGPKTTPSTPGLLQVREYVKTIGGFRSVRIVERSRNIGLAKSITDGVSRLCEEFDRVIVVEDDIVTSPHFLRFMNEGLELYADVARVMQVSGYMFPVPLPPGFPETFLYRAPTCWGWATWKRAWKFFEPDPTKLLSGIRGRALEYEFDIHGTAPHMQMLQDQAARKIDSWVIRWYGSVFLNDGLCLYPARSLTDNIGTDGTGVHGGVSTSFSVDLARPHDIRLDSKLPVAESAAGVDAHERFYRSLRKSLPRRILSVLARNARRFTGAT
jgi:hypothetical protein